MDILISKYSLQIDGKHICVVEATESMELCCENPVKEKQTKVCGHKPYVQASRKTKYRMTNGSEHSRVIMQSVGFMIKLWWKPKIKQISIVDRRN